MSLLPELVLKKVAIAIKMSPLRSYKGVALTEL
jgi:hypothetical protein